MISTSSKKGLNLISTHQTGYCRCANEEVYPNNVFGGKSKTFSKVIILRNLYLIRKKFIRYAITIYSGLSIL